MILKFKKQILMLTIRCFTTFNLPSFLVAEVYNSIIVYIVVGIINHKIENKIHIPTTSIIFDLNLVILVLYNRKY